MSPIGKNCPTWASHHCFSESSSCFVQHVFYYGAIQEWEGEGIAPNSSVNVTCISRQYFILRQPDSSLWAGDQDGKWKGELSSSSGSHRSFASWVGTSAWPSTWRLAPDVSSTRLLNVAAIDMKLVAVNWNSEYSHSFWGAKALARNHINHLIWGNCFPYHVVWDSICTPPMGLPLRLWECLQPGRKVVTYLQEPPSLAN